MFRLISTILLILLVTMYTDVYGQSASDKQAKIQSASDAAHDAIIEKATIKDWDGTVLREGTNKWTCYPDMPNLPEQNPMCLDDQWIEWMEAYLNQEEPNITQVGLGYMLRGGSPASNIDPFAEGPTADNQWMNEVKPHLMILFPDADMYEGISTDPENGGPWVMFPETPYAHIMMPVK